MRWFLTTLVVAFLVAELVAAAPQQAYAAGTIALDREITQVTPSVTADHAYAAKKPAARSSSKKKKKKSSPSSSSTSGSDVIITSSPGPGPVLVPIFALKDATIGEKNVFVQAMPATPGLACHLVVRYRTGDQSPAPDVVADGSNACKFHFDAPDDRNIIGTAGILISVYAPSAPGVNLGTGTQPFTAKKR